jgi:hypothetical protein
MASRKAIARHRNYGTENEHKHSIYNGLRRRATECDPLRSLRFSLIIGRYSKVNTLRERFWSGEVRDLPLACIGRCEHL